MFVITMQIASAFPLEWMHMGIFDQAPSSSGNVVKESEEG